MKKIFNIILAFVVVLYGTAQTTGFALAQATSKVPEISTAAAVSNQFPAGGTVNALVIDPITSTTLYAGTNYGIYKTINNGDTWSLIGLSAKMVYSIAVDPTNPANVYAGTNGQGFYFSRDGGLSWAEASVIQNIVIYTIAIDPVTPGNIYLGGPQINVDGSGSDAWGGGAFKSSDYGNSWISINTNLPEGWVYSIVINPYTPNILYAATYSKGVYKSFDGGLTWAARNTGLVTTKYPSADNLKIRTLAMSPFSPNQLMAGLWAGISVFETEDGGDLWNWAGKNVNGATIRSIAYNPSTGGLVYLGQTQRGPMFNVNNGYVAWDPFPNQAMGNWGYFQSINAIVVSPQNNNGSTLFMAVSGLGVIRSLDKGTTWKVINTGLNATSITAIVADPANSNTIYASTNGSGVFKSTDKGATWSSLDWPRQWDFVQDVAVDAANSNTVYIATTNYGLGVSYDAGASWNSFNANLPSAPVRAAAAPAMVVSADGVETALAPALTDALPSLTSIVVADTKPTEMLYAGTSTHGIYESLDLGVTWKLVTGSDAKITAMQVFPNTPSAVLASSNNQGVILLTNYGYSYAYSTNGLPSVDIRSILVDPVTPTTFYAGTTTGIYISKDSGASWIYFGLTGNIINALAKDNSGKLYAGTVSNGLISTSDGGVTWQSEISVPGGTVNAIYSDLTSTFAFIQIGTDGGGIQKIASTIITNLSIRITH